MRHSALYAEARIRKDWIPAFVGMTKSNNNFLETALAAATGASTARRFCGGEDSV